MELAYLLSPMHLIPNFIPVGGYSDDLAVFSLALRYACQRAGPEKVRGAWPGDPAHLERLLGPVLGTSLPRRMTTTASLAHRLRRHDRA